LQSTCFDIKKVGTYHNQATCTKGFVFLYSIIIADTVSAGIP